MAVLLRYHYLHHYDESTTLTNCVTGSRASTRERQHVVDTNSSSSSSSCISLDTSISDGRLSVVTSEVFSNSDLVQLVTRFI